MTATNVNISIGSELEAKAQSVLSELGLDVPTAVNIFLTQMVDKRAFPFDLSDEAFESYPTKIPQPGCLRGESWMSDGFYPPLPPGTTRPDPTKVPQPGCMRGKIWMAEDFDAPMEEFEEYM